MDRPAADCSRKMTYGSIELLPMPASRIVFGTAVGPMTAGENADALLDGAAERGINFFDCARSYGRAEEVLGGWIRRRRNREKVIVLTKCGDIRDGVVKVNRQVIREQLETSLKTLQTDYIDIFLLHREEPNRGLQRIQPELRAGAADGGPVGRRMRFDRRTGAPGGSGMVRGDPYAGGGLFEPRTGFFQRQVPLG